MSFLINWNLLSDGKEAEKLRDFINLKFQSESRPNFLGTILVTELDFGTIPPEIIVTDICDPMDEFYYEIDEEYNSYTGREQQLLETPRDSSHVQLEILINYKGNMKMAISTAFIINQPTENFMVLPLSLSITGLSFKATCVVAYLGNIINFCLKEPLHEEIIRDVTIQSVIGDQNVLNNVGKIEKFIVEQLQKFLGDYMVFPNYHSIILEED